MLPQPTKTVAYVVIYRKTDKPNKNRRKEETFQGGHPLAWLHIVHKTVVVAVLEATEDVHVEAMSKQRVR